MAGHEWAAYPQSVSPGAEWAVWEVGPFWVRHAQHDPASAQAEADRLEWLRPRFPCADVVAVDDGWIVTTSVPGQPALRPHLQLAPDEIPAAIGAGLRKIHDVVDHTALTEECPFRWGWDDVIARVRGALEAGRVDGSRFPAPYDRYNPERLLELAIEGRPETGDADLVVGLGQPLVENLFVDNGRLSGVMGVHRLGVTDRHLDLAVAHRSINAAFGSEAVFGFYEGYDLHTDIVRLDHFVLIDVLCSSIGSVPVGQE